jgi:2-polyprenyl-6-methoxyphenol hydroxylase-like FAD-dependent oxidoreductase
MSQDKPDSAQAVRQTNQSFFFESDIFSAGRLLARRARPGGVVHEPARAIPVLRECDVLVVGGGPSGTAAAVAAARTGADVVLLERYNHLGGLSTGGLVIWIDRMTDWTGAQVIQGIANDLLDRLPKDAIAGPPRGLWGSADAATAAYWRERTAAYHGIVTWSPTIDPERLKLASQELVLESGVQLLLHGLGCAPIMQDGAVAGVVFESKEGRLAIRARVTVDCTGDGDIFHPRRRRSGHRHRGARHPPLHEHVVDLGRLRPHALDRVQDRRRGRLLRLHGPRACAVRRTVRAAVRVVAQ